jgi:hypothetical protein
MGGLIKRYNKIGGQWTANFSPSVKSLLFLASQGCFLLIIKQPLGFPPIVLDEISIVDLTRQTFGLLNPILNLAGYG